MKKNAKLCIVLIFSMLFLISCATTSSNNESENVYSEDYKLYDSRNITIKELCEISEEFYKYLLFTSGKSFGYGIYEIPVTLCYYSKWNSKKEKWVSSELVLREIMIENHVLGNGKPGTDEYIIFKTEKEIIPFFTSENKKSSVKDIMDEYFRRIQQIKRIAENRHLKPNKFEYQDLPVLDMPTMGVLYAPNPALEIGKVYIADRFRFFYVINRMRNGDYNIGQDYGSYGRYQFIIHNTCGESMEGIGGHMFAETAYLRYLGKIETVTDDGYIQYLPYFEMLKMNPHESIVDKIIRECKSWENISEDALDL